MVVMKICRTCNGEKPLTAYREKRSDCRECERAKHRAWHNENRELILPKMREYMKEHYAKNPEQWKTNAKKWGQENPEKRLAICRNNVRNQRLKLSNCYVRRMLAESMRIKASQVPQVMVEAQRELLKLKRAINEKL